MRASTEAIHHEGIMVREKYHHVSCSGLFGSGVDAGHHRAMTVGSVTSGSAGRTAVPMRNNNSATRMAGELRASPAFFL
jgi:hypothetical protein